MIRNIRPHNLSEKIKILLLLTLILLFSLKRLRAFLLAYSAYKKIPVRGTKLQTNINALGLKN